MPLRVRPVPEELRDIGARIVSARNELGLNQKELAERAGVDATVLNRVEKRKQHDPTASFVVRVAAALGRSTDLLLTGRPGASGVTLVAETGVPRDLVEATAREIVARVIPLIPSGNQSRPKRSGAGGKLRGSKRDAGKA